MLVEQHLSSRLTLSGVIVAVLLSASNAFAGASEDCAAAAADGQQDYAATLRLCRPLAEQGDAKAQSRLGFMYLTGQGVAQSDTEAAKWYRRAADQGDPAAQDSLGSMYYAAQNYVEAAKWTRLAAEQGHFAAQAALGLMYANGQGVPQDYVLAHMSYNLASVHDQDAIKARDGIAAKMTPEQIAEAQRMAREWRPTK
jgi:hypothetical protein